jgi:hypothetical protein
MKGRQLGLVVVSAAPQPEPLLKPREGACRPLLSRGKTYIELTRGPKAARAPMHDAVPVPAGIP